MRLISIATALCAFLAVSCAAQQAKTEKPAAKPEARAEAPATRPVSMPATRPGRMLLDDGRRMATLTRQATRLIETEKTTKMAELIAGLKNEKAAVKLVEGAKGAIAPEELYEKIKPSVLVVASIYKCNKCTQWHARCAGGFPISASGVCVTNYHVVNLPDSETIVAMNEKGRVFPVKAVLAGNKAEDVALIQVDSAELPPLPLAAAAKEGTPIWIISHPMQRFYSMTSGIVSRYYEVRSAAGTARQMAVTADFAQGSSGAPAFNARGEAVGFVANTSALYAEQHEGRPQSIQMVVKECVPAASILKLIEKSAATQP